MSYPINYPTPQGANVQIFRGGDDSSTAHVATRDWVKPQGASFVFFTLIGAGGGGCGTNTDTLIPGIFGGGGGGSGAVTNFMCPAFLLPDVLQIAVGRGGNGGLPATDARPANGTDGNPTQIIYQQKDGTGYILLEASYGGGGQGNNGGIGTGGNAAAVFTGSPMTAAGFLRATAGQVGKNGGATATTNGLTFLMGGSGTVDSATTITGYYGYTARQNSGYSQISPIIMSIAGSSPVDSSTSVAAPFGCGGNGGSDTSATSGSRGGDGLAIIVTW
jgi:hypothetical protein